MDSPGLHVSKPIAVWNKPLNANFKDLFKALGKGGVDAATGQWGGLAKDLVDASVAVGLGNDPGQMAWLLIYRSLAQAMANLIGDSNDLLVNAPDDIDALCDHLDLSLESTEFSIDPKFFENPKQLTILEPIRALLAQLLDEFVTNQSQSQAIAARLPTYFVLALDREWRSRSQEYQILRGAIDTPFTQASQREQEWRLYAAWLQKQIDEPMFLEAFGLNQIYVPLIAYYRQKVSQNSFNLDGMGTRGQIAGHYERVVVDLEDELNDWLDAGDRNDAIRIISGGPGSGKSSFAKIFAAYQAAKGRSVLFVPLHQFDPKGDLEEAVGNFIRYDEFLSVNPLDRDHGEKRLFIIFDGLDELALQSKVSKEIAQGFIREVQWKVERFNYRDLKLQVLISGRELVVQDNSSEFRQSRQILHLLPYFVPEDKRKKDAGESYVDSAKLLNVDRRQHWWQNYGQISGQSYTELPQELNQGTLIEITTQPLLNYLVALSYGQSNLTFSEETNLNQIYENLLNAVYERGYERRRTHASIRGMEKQNFIRILEEIALAAWHGDGRTTTVQDIEAHCDSSGLKRLLTEFEEGARLGVTRLLAAFYFRQGIGMRDGERTFEFTHKSFGEYLTARRIVRAMHRIHTMLEKRKQDVDDGWDERDALVHWAKVCGSLSRMSQYLFDFVKNEVRLQEPQEVAQWQQSFVTLIDFLMRNWMPMEHLPRTKFRHEAVRARHAEEALFAALNSCACVTQQLSGVNWPYPQSFGGLLKTLQGQRTGSENPVILNALGYLNLSNCTLIYGDLLFANLERANLEGAKLFGANLEGANLEGANLEGANLGEVKLFGAKLFGANLEGAKLEGADLFRAKLEGAKLFGANLEGAKLEGANLEGANLEGTNLEGANLEGANLEGANLEGANLFEISWDTQAEWSNVLGIEKAINIPMQLMQELGLD